MIRKKLQKRRKEIFASYRDLAKLLNMKRDRYFRIEHGLVMPTKGEAKLIAQVLYMDIEDVLVSTTKTNECKVYTLDKDKLEFMLRTQFGEKLYTSMYKQKNTALAATSTVSRT